MFVSCACCRTGLTDVAVLYPAREQISRLAVIRYWRHAWLGWYSSLCLHLLPHPCWPPWQGRQLVNIFDDLLLKSDRPSVIVVYNHEPSLLSKHLEVAYEGVLLYPCLPNCCGLSHDSFYYCQEVHYGRLTALKNATLYRKGVIRRLIWLYSFAFPVFNRHRLTTRQIHSSCLEYMFSCKTFIFLLRWKWKGRSRLGQVQFCF